MATTSSSPRELGHSSESARYNADVFIVQDLTKPEGSIYTGLGFLDHMLDQFNSHAQIGVSITMGDFDGTPDTNVLDRNRFGNHDQAKLQSLVGSKLGLEFRRLLEASPTTGTVSSFSCPLDEALVSCVLERTPDDKGTLNSYTLEPFGSVPKGGRKYLGHLQTACLQVFWQSLAEHAGLQLSLRKVRGDNAHHVCESSFKAFTRALRNLLDGVNTDYPLDSAASLYGPNSANWQASLALDRQGTVSRRTKETSIDTVLRLDGGATGVTIATGVATLDAFLTTLAQSANVSLQVKCQGDLWIDEHHTAEDVAIAVGQVIFQALGTKAGLNRMWCASAEQGNSKVQVTMDLSNRPCLVQNLSLETENHDERIGDLSMEMFLHVLESLVTNARMTVHIVQLHPNPHVADTVDAVAVAFGTAFSYCAMVDQRRSGVTASSKGTLSV